MNMADCQPEGISLAAELYSSGDVAEKAAAKIEERRQQTMLIGYRSADDAADLQ